MYVCQRYNITLLKVRIIYIYIFSSLWLYFVYIINIFSDQAKDISPRALSKSGLAVFAPDLTGKLRVLTKSIRAGFEKSKPTMRLEFLAAQLNASGLMKVIRMAVVEQEFHQTTESNTWKRSQLVNISG